MLPIVVGCTKLRTPRTNVAIVYDPAGIQVTYPDSGGLIYNDDTHVWRLGKYKKTLRNVIDQRRIKSVEPAHADYILYITSLEIKEIPILDDTVPTTQIMISLDATFSKDEGGVTFYINESSHYNGTDHEWQGRDQGNTGFDDGFNQEMVNCDHAKLVEQAIKRIIRENN